MRPLRLSVELKKTPKNDIFTIIERSDEHVNSYWMTLESLSLGSKKPKVKSEIPRGSAVSSAVLLLPIARHHIL
ncbi:hypothetical protein A2V82_09905 [candidate division KSB1 bacterium RBG_16_48_16]|nr:MAG: hypothetical protein A2V82_09905 [candidate division KSB1 bacterium RBG_16_48_16]